MSIDPTSVVCPIGGVAAGVECTFAPEAHIPVTRIHGDRWSAARRHTSAGSEGIAGEGNVRPELVAGARAFLDAYHQRPDVWDELGPDDEMGLTPRANTVRGVIAALIAITGAPQKGDFMAACARCGTKKVVTSDPLNLELDVCGSCGVDIGRDLQASSQPSSPEPARPQ